MLPGTTTDGWKDIPKYIRLCVSGSVYVYVSAYNREDTRVGYLAFIIGQLKRWQSFFEEFHNSSV